MKHVKTSLVIGGACLSGIKLCKTFVDQGYYTFCIDNLSGISSNIPEKWPAEINCVHSNKFIFIKEDCCDFFINEAKCFTHFDIVVFLIHNECCSITEHAFSKWLENLSYIPKKVISVNYNLSFNLDVVRSRHSATYR